MCVVWWLVVVVGVVVGGKGADPPHPKPEKNSGGFYTPLLRTYYRSLKPRALRRANCAAITASFVGASLEAGIFAPFSGLTHAVALTLIAYPSFSESALSWICGQYAKQVVCN